MLKKKEVKIPVTLSDCLSLHKKGYNIEVNDGQIITVTKGKKQYFRKWIHST